jgi:hypothetical protein
MGQALARENTYEGAHHFHKDDIPIPGARNGFDIVSRSIVSQ